MFADDTTISVKAKTMEDAQMLMNNDLKKIFQWLNINKLKLNIDKTKCMIFSKRNIQTDKYLNFDGNKIERVNEIKYLGFIITEKLKLHAQIKKCISKAAFKVNMLKRLSNKLTFDARKIVYNTLVQPNFDYCSTLYLNANKEQIKQMQKIQNRGMRVILKCDYRTPKKYMLNCLEWLSISQRIKFNTLVMIFKIKNNMLPNYIRSEINFVNDMSERTLRNSNDFRLPNFKSELTRNSIFYQGLKIFNELPSKIKEIKTLSTFKTQCKKHIIQSCPIS